METNQTPTAHTAGLLADSTADASLRRPARSRVRVGLAAVGLGLMFLTAGAAFARGQGEPGHFKKAILSKVDQALDSAKATPEQKATIEAAVKQVFAVIKENRQGKKAIKAEALALFEGDSFDAAKVQALRSEQQARQARVGDAIQNAIKVAHQTLSPEQRKAVTAHIRTNFKHRAAN